MKSVKLISRRIRNLFILAFLSFVDSLAIKKHVDFVPKTLLLIRIDSIGDYILFRNFIEVLKSSEKYKDYKITLCGNVIWKDIAETFDKHFVDDFIWVDRKKFGRNIYYRLSVLRDINQRGYETVIQPTFSREYFCADAIVRATGANERIGNLGHKKTIRRWRKIISDRYYTHLIQTTCKSPFVFLIDKDFFEKLLSIRIEMKKPYINAGKAKSPAFTKNRYAVIFPGASLQSKQWDTGNFAKIADYLYLKYNLEILIAGGVQEGYLAEEIIRKTEMAQVVNITGKTELSELAKVLSRATLLVSNDTAAVHMAVAVNTRVVYVLNGEHFGTFGPYPKEVFDKIYAIYPKEIMDRTDDMKYLCNKFRGLTRLDINSISAEDVVRLIDAVMQNSEVYELSKTI